MLRSLIAFACLFCIAPAAAAQPATTTVNQYRPHDFSFTAPVQGNPFDIELYGEFVGPDGARLRIPGFYDGDGTWKIRFMAPEPGEWRLRTVSPVPALHGQEREIRAVANANPRIHGLLRIDPEHPYHFRFSDGTRFFLLGYEADWLGLADLEDPERRVTRRLIEQMSDRGFNYVLVNIYAHDTRWASGNTVEWDYGPPAMYAFGGTNEAPDHTRLNPEFFREYDKMMDALWQRGIIAHIMLKVYNKNVTWPEKGSPEERRYFEYVVARYQAYPNVVWDYSKESYNEKNEQLQHHLLDLVRATDAYDHLTTAHDDDRYEWDPELSSNLDFRIDQHHSKQARHHDDYSEMIAFDRAMRARPVVNAEFGYEYGVEDLPTHTHRNQSDWKEHLRRAYRVYFAGGYGVYYYNNTAWDVVKPDPEPPGMARWQVLKQTLSDLSYWRMSPCNQLASGALVLCEPGSTYVFYVQGERVTVNLTGIAGEATGRWIDTWTGERVELETLPSSAQVLEKPAGFGEAPAVLLVRARDAVSTGPVSSRGLRE